MSPNRTPAQRALQLTDAIYAAAVTPPLWTRFLDAFGDDLGGASIAMSLQLPGTMAPPEYYRTRLSAEYVPAFERHFRLGLPWPMTDPLFREGFRRGSELFPDEDVHRTGYYRDYMQPQGMAPEGPIAHVIFTGERRPISGISIQRMEGDRHLDADDLAMCNLLAPHLARAHAVRRQLQTSRREQGARAEVLDRIPIGVVLVDGQRRVVGSNRAGDEILEQRDGIQLDDGRLCAERHENHDALAGPLDRAAQADEPTGGFATIERPSGRRPYSVIVSPLLDAPSDTQVGDRVAAVFITDPQTSATGLASSFDAFQQMYDLTPAQTELVALLAEGRSLEEISSERSVTIHTTRSQLKQIFAKTETRRQSELVRIVLSEIAGVRKT